MKILHLSIIFGIGIAILVVIGFFFILSSSQSNLKLGLSGNNDIIDISRECDIPFPKYTTQIYPNGTLVATAHTPVLYMPKNSIGKICTQYFNRNSQEKAELAIYPSNNMSQLANLAISAYPDIFAKGNGAIVYTIKTGNFTGIYDISECEGGCSAQPFAVGYDNKSSIVLNGFSSYTGNTGPYGLPNIRFFYISGLSDIGIHDIIHVARKQIEYNVTGVSVSSVHPTPTSQNVTFTVHIQTYNSSAKISFDPRTTTVVKYIGDPQFKQYTDPCNWFAYNDKHAYDKTINLAGGFRVKDNPVTIPSYSNGTYTFSIFAENLDHGWYDLSPSIYIQPPNIPFEKLNNQYIANQYPMTIGLDSNLDASGSCSFWENTKGEQRLVFVPKIT